MSPGVKICGITRREDALAAAALGVEALGFNFSARSRRYLPPAAAGRIIRALPPSVIAVGVFVDASTEEIHRAVEDSGVAVVQLHGDEPPEEVDAVRPPVIKALRASPTVGAQMRRYRASAFLLDGASGGSGVRFDWALVEGLPRDRPLYLAGGLDPDNVGDAVRRVRPDFVDVATGVEDGPGLKSAERMARFIRAAREA